MPDAAEREGRAFICPHCEKPAVAHLRGQAIYEEHKEFPGYVRLPTEYLFEQCGNCNEVTISGRADWGDGFDGEEYFVIYPQTHELSPQIPSTLQREYEEAKNCFSSKAYTATVVMVRRILEGVCKENNIQERVLFESVEKLKDSGLINDTLAEWMNALRIVGNEGAHYTGRPVKKEDAQDSLDFAEALLDNIYVLNKRFAEFKARRNRDE